MKGAGEVDQWLRALATLQLDPGSVSSTHTAAHNHAELQSQEIQNPPLIFIVPGRHMHGAYTHM